MHGRAVARDAFWLRVLISDRLECLQNENEASEGWGNILRWRLFHQLFSMSVPLLQYDHGDG